MSAKEDAEMIYRRGYQDGYEAAEAAANASWRGQERIFHAGGWLDGPTAAEKREADMSVLAQAHAAGLHTGQAIRCVECNPPSRMVNQRTGEVTYCHQRPCAVDPTHPARDDQGNMHVHVGSPLHHKGNYGVPAGRYRPNDADHYEVQCGDRPNCTITEHHAGDFLRPAGDV
jgi:hypothetical protein